ncbi:YdiU family protein [Verminephrobacter aporrectodeae subsp. tuberculatae]|uniref:protein adenylyltransferase SelO n=1 Tax=Verminephrobacter aporrectodeae TaxID=1110389 RepID=UPI00224441C4|nr:YdiU family protein [Verminephrobacter aporrectodeae]MCW8163747.1 YdiU family protein [Verminephrobacter aporrectodeae subsp. tuberculatae]MCW8167983.1 YdiU family protein [Verminephrobacter aporrectodeae subsp. tuberculatae]
MNLRAESDTPADVGLDWSHGFAALGPDFFTELRPAPLPRPHWVGTSPDVARLIGLDASWLQSDAALQAFTGNTLLAGSRPLASVYGGHQFGVWAGQLGDGRAILLGETAGGMEIQLKGAGRTPYSRMGDGRAVLRSSIREFLCSEAMHGLGIPTTRALCLSGSPAPVHREEPETAAVLTRVAPSFLRFGHFEHFAANGLQAQLQALADYTVDRYYPECRAAAERDLPPCAALLQAVSERTARLMAQWQAVGFCHGVMNTDNMSILGLSIDYGPFQFLDAFVPGHICNHSDAQGRYAYDRQPDVAYWNLLCLAQALLPLIGDPDLAMQALASYQATFSDEFMARMRAKLGLLEPRAEDAQLIDAILLLLARNAVDYPIFWRRLSHAVQRGDFQPVRDLFADGASLDPWLRSYAQRMACADPAPAADWMLASNPKYVLRKHLGEQAIRTAKQGDFSELQTLQRLLGRPFDEHPGYDAYAAFPPDWASAIEISCSS